MSLWGQCVGSVPRRDPGEKLGVHRVDHFMVLWEWSFSQDRDMIQGKHPKKTYKLEVMRANGIWHSFSECELLWGPLRHTVMPKLPRVPSSRRVLRTCPGFLFCTTVLICKLGESGKSWEDRWSSFLEGVVATKGGEAFVLASVDARDQLNLTLLSQPEWLGFGSKPHHDVSCRQCRHNVIAQSCCRPGPCSQRSPSGETLHRQTLAVRGRERHCCLHGHLR